MCPALRARRDEKRESVGYVGNKSDVRLKDHFTLYASGRYPRVLVKKNLLQPGVVVHMLVARQGTYYRP